MGIKTEEKAIDAMLHRGVKVSIPKRSPLKYIGKKDRDFTIYQSYLGTLLEISRVALKLDYSEKQISENAFTESKQLARQHCKSMALIAAISILNSRWGITLFSRMLARYLLWRMTPEKLVQLSVVVMQMNNISDFINSIRLMSGVRLAQTKNLSPDDNGG